MQSAHGVKYVQRAVVWYKAIQVLQSIERGLEKGHLSTFEMGSGLTNFKKIMSRSFWKSTEIMF